MKSRRVWYAFLFKPFASLFFAVPDLSLMPVESENVLNSVVSNARSQQILSGVPCCSGITRRNVSIHTVIILRLMYFVSEHAAQSSIV